jgi:sugar/nucleoside kinase (ribokinase family)
MALVPLPPIGVVTCLGTLKMDVGARLTDHRFVAGEDAYEVAPVLARPGGTAVNFASAASGLFKEVHLIAAVGDDALTASLVAGAEAVSSSHLQACESQPNAVVITVRDAPDENGRSNRLLVAAQQSPHLQLTADHVVGCREVIEAADFLVCDAYSLQHPRSSRALVEALRIARDAGVRSVLDLVPHTLPSTMSRSQVAPALDQADVVVSEAWTLLGLARQQWPVELPAPADLRREAEAAARLLNPEATWIVRHGFEGIGEVFVLWPNGAGVEYCTTYSRTADRHRYGDRLLAREIHSILVSRHVPLFWQAGHEYGEASNR